MKIRSTQSRPLPPDGKRDKTRETFEPGVDNYYGPKDGKSKAPPFPLVKDIALTIGTSLFRRVEVQGRENLPLQGKHVYSPNHISILDVPIVENLGVKDMRLLTDIQVFRIPVVADLAGAIGCYPVSREKACTVTKKHTLEVLSKEGAGLTIFPEGGYSEDPNIIAPFHKGAAAAAILGKADSLVPLAFHRSPNKDPRLGEFLAGLALATGVAALPIAASFHPGSATFVNSLAGALTGAFSAGVLAKSVIPESHPANPAKEAMTLGSRALGAVGGALAGYCAGPILGPQSVALLGGLSTLGLSESWRNRDIHQIKVGQPIAVKSYQKRAETHKSEAIKELTTLLHRRVGAMKAELSGIPYDPQSKTIATEPLPDRF